MYFRHDPFGLRPHDLVMHRRRSSRHVASIPFSASEELPGLALKSRARVTARPREGRIHSFVAWVRALPRMSKDGPRAA